MYLEECASTNTYLLDVLSSQNIVEGTVLRAVDQTSGKGQMGNVWTSEKGKNLTFSMVMHPSFLTVENQYYLTKWVSVSVIQVLSHLTGKSFEIKWPNDIYCEGQKIAGILIENVVKQGGLHSSVVGIGLNVNQEDFGIEGASSLKTLTGKDFEIDGVLERLCEKMEANYLKFRKDAKCMDRDYLANLYQRGDLTRYEDENGEFEGEIIGVDERGKLMVRVGEEMRKFDLKEITFKKN